MHIVVWRNKPDLGSISFDDLYNNFKIVEQDVKTSVILSSNSSSQNVTFVLTPGSTNDVNTSNVHVSTVSSSLSTASTTDNTARLSDADEDDNYDDDFYDCVDFEEEGGKIDLDISKIVDIPLREKLVESYL
ncbi:hypothetical protein Tco_0575502, partial [Tanacetum coccineum]